MMKTRYNIVLLGAALMCGACAEDVFVENMPSNEALTITISTEPISRDTRAVEHIGYTDDVVEQNLNENRIRTVDIYMFPSATITDASQISYHLPRITVSDEGDGEMGIETISLMINNTVFEAALGGITPEQAITQNKRYYASIIVNQPSDITVEAGETFEQLKAKTTSCAQFASGEVVPTFVMTGNATLAVRHDNDANCYVLYNPVAGYITVERCAAKIDLVVDDVQEYIRDEYGNFWKSVPSTLKASFYHGVKKTSLAADLSYEPVMPPTNPHDYFDVTPSRSFVQATADNRPMFDAGDYYTVSDGKHMPYYSYPSLWDGNDFDKKKEAYFLLQMDWQEIKGRTKVDNVTVTAETEGAEAAIDSNGNTIYFINDGNADTEPVLTSYQLPITSSFLTNANRFIRNNYYRLCVKVGIIGSFDPGNPETIKDNTYIVADWSKESINMNLHEAAYLTVNEHEKTLNNQTQGYVTYSSSPDATATITRIQFNDYKGNTITARDITSGSAQTGNVNLGFNNFSVEATDDGRILLTVKGNILSQIYTAVTLTVKVSNGVSQDQEVTFTVYPPIYITGHKSTPASVYVRGQKARTTGSSYQSVYDYNGYDIGSVQDANSVNGSGTNNNQNLYTIHVSSLSATSEYTIGDPRTVAIDNVVGNTNGNPLDFWSVVGSPQYTWDLQVAQSWGSYEEETGTFYFSYSEYNADREHITRGTEQTGNQYNVLNNWGNYNSEANSYFNESDGYCYWRTGGRGNRVYHRIQYSRTGTRYSHVDKLTQYHPTKENIDGYMIAPEFQIASSYGKTTEVTYQRAKERCASYQEDGYPAGRWRLPTKGEIQFAVELSRDGIIPTLFNGRYWAANGTYGSGYSSTTGSFTDYTNNNNTNYVRCVYDIWYWGDEHSTYANQFHYGDADPRE